MSVRHSLLAALLALFPMAGCGAETTPVGADAPLALERKIPLKDIHGRIDHLAVDAAHQRLFVAELGAGSVEAVDVGRGVSLGRITGLKEPQGLAYLPGPDELVVASGGDGAVRFYRAADLSLLGTVALGDDADNVRVDPRSGRVIVGYGSGALAIIDPATRGKVDLPAHPEAFSADGSRVFVNAPTAGRIVIADLASGRIISSWPASHHFNFPMAFDGPSDTLAVVYRLPARLQLFDASTGASKSDVATCGDADDVYFDDRRSRLYVVCGAGMVDVFAAKTLARVARIRSRGGARTGLFAPELDRLFVAARAAGAGDSAAILVFRPQH